MKKLLCLTALLASTAHADTLYGLYVDANYWHASNETTQNNTNTKHKDGGQLMVSASLEHGVPFVPNARVHHVSLDSTEKTTDIKHDLSSTDVIAYYELLDNMVNLDVGLGAKILEGEIEGKNTDSTTDLSKTLPMAYVSAGVKLPLTGLSAKAEVGVAHNNKYKATDAQAEIKYNFIDKAFIDVGGKLGYRMINIEADKLLKDDSDYKNEFKGPYAGLEIHF
ncbi:TIGR04219 family outer membrane beta-barrel protein [Moraxella oblonga]|uniref:TIGR04219 family outer membrane beta-barrel protein n=1 Tax=Moraxella oblonga TaxID=200413 RepID=UPI000835F2CB|nr:TIGR04219 family outer membrane beta-barrel protein [Moraxella oblonga]